METVTVDREYDADGDAVRAALADVTTFFEAAGFDARRDGTSLTLEKRVAITRLRLEARLLEGDAAALAYEQTDGPFEAMRTRYVVEDAGDGSRLTIETTFEAPTSGFGSFVNGAVVERQRRGELEAVDSLV